MHYFVNTQNFEDYECTNGMYATTINGTTGLLFSSEMRLHSFLQSRDMKIINSTTMGEYELELSYAEVDENGEPIYYDDEVSMESFSSTFTVKTIHYETTTRSQRTIERMQSMESRKREITEEFISSLRVIDKAGVKYYTSFTPSYTERTIHPCVNKFIVPHIKDDRGIKMVIATKNCRDPSLRVIPENMKWDYKDAFTVFIDTSLDSKSKFALPLEQGQEWSGNIHMTEYIMTSNATYLLKDKISVLYDHERTLADIYVDPETLQPLFVLVYCTPIEGSASVSTSLMNDLFSIIGEQLKIIADSDSLEELRHNNIIRVLKKSYSQKFDRLTREITNKQNDAAKNLRMYQLLRKNISVAAKELELFSSDKSFEDLSQHLVNQLAALEKFPKIERIVTLSNGSIELYTTEMHCMNPATQRLHLLGKFQLTINLFNVDEIPLRMVNITGAKQVMGRGVVHAPHIFHEAPCLGSITEIVSDLVDKKDLVGLASIAIAFLESVNLEDSGGPAIKLFPQVENKAIKEAEKE